MKLVLKASQFITITNHSYNFYIWSHDIDIEFKIWHDQDAKIMMTHQQMKGGCKFIMRCYIFTACFLLSIIATSEAGKKHYHYFKFNVLHFSKRFLFVFFKKCIMCKFLFQLHCSLIQRHVVVKLMDGLSVILIMAQLGFANHAKGFHLLGIVPMTVSHMPELKTASLAARKISPSLESLSIYLESVQTFEVCLFINFEQIFQSIVPPCR